MLRRTKHSKNEVVAPEEEEEEGEDGQYIHPKRVKFFTKIK